jgi:hypothetical protein
MAQQKPLLSFIELSSIASNLNKTSDEFKKVIEDLDQGLQRLNVGISSWVTVEKWNDPDDPTECEVEQLGYVKYKGNWGIYIREAVGREDDPEDRTVNVWLFNEASREARMRALGKLPELIDALARSALQTTEIMSKKVAEAKRYAAAINGLSPANTRQDVIGKVGEVKK